MDVKIEINNPPPISSSETPVSIQQEKESKNFNVDQNKNDGQKIIKENPGPD